MRGQRQDGDWTKISADSALEGKKIVAFYFSAHWCPPCRAFTPMLKDAYEEYLEESEDLEIIFVSSDRTSDDMKSYMQEAHGKWLAVPHDSELGKALKSKFALAVQFGNCKMTTLGIQQTRVSNFIPLPAPRMEAYIDTLVNRTSAKPQSNPNISRTNY